MTEWAASSRELGRVWPVLNDEVSERARSARHIHPDSVVRYYDRKEASGARIVRQVDKGRLAGREVYIMHENFIEDREVNGFY